MAAFGDEKMEGFTDRPWNSLTENLYDYDLQSKIYKSLHCLNFIATYLLRLHELQTARCANQNQRRVFCRSEFLHCKRTCQWICATGSLNALAFFFLWWFWPRFVIYLNRSNWREYRRTSNTTRIQFNEIKKRRLVSFLSMPQWFDRFKIFVILILSFDAQHLQTFSDMMLYGLCPAQDEFFLAICERCKLLVKPQALKKHIGQA